MALVVIEQSELEDIIQKIIDKAFAKQNLTVVPEPIFSGLIQAPEAAKILNVSLSTIHTYKKQGTLPFHRIGRRVYFRESEILSSLKKIN